VPNDHDLERMTVSMTALGWATLQEWPKSFERDDRTWVLQHVTIATETGEVQCAEYQSGPQEWFIVYNE